MSRTAKAILWMCSGPILLFTAALLQVIIRFVLGGADGGILATIVNIASWLAGLLGMILIFVGPIVGIVLLAKKQK